MQLNVSPVLITRIICLAVLRTSLRLSRVLFRQHFLVTNLARLCVALHSQHEEARAPQYTQEYGKVYGASEEFSTGSVRVPFVRGARGGYGIAGRIRR